MKTRILIHRWPSPCCVLTWWKEVRELSEFFYFFFLFFCFFLMLEVFYKDTNPTYWGGGPPSLFNYLPKSQIHVKYILLVHFQSKDLEADTNTQSVAHRHSFTVSRPPDRNISNCKPASSVNHSAKNSSHKPIKWSKPNPSAKHRHN